MPSFDVSLRAVLLVALGGAIGCVLRYLVGVLLARPAFSWGTLVVNVVGSFAIGALMFAWLGRGDAPVEMRAFAITGVLGGFTTMSSFAFETVALADSSLVGAALYAVVTMIACVGAAIAGRAVAVALG